MKPLKALISKNTIHRAHIKEDWPNPYNLTKEDAKGKLEGWPLEIITLALLETKLIRDPSYTVKDLQERGVDCIFTWTKSKDGQDFWNNINHKIFNDFYKVYTPEKLKERLTYETP